MKRLEVQKLTTKRQITEAIRNGLTLITMDNLYITVEMLERHIVDSNKLSPLWYNVLRGVLFDATDNYDLPRIEWVDVDHYIQRLVKDGHVLFTESDDVVTIYDAEGDLVEQSGIIDTPSNKIDIYIPEPEILEHVYEKLTGMEGVLCDLGIHIEELPVLFEEIIDDEDYRFVYDLIVYY